AMLMEGVVGVVALLAAASLDPGKHYFPINTALAEQPKYKESIERIEERVRAREPLHSAGVRDPHQLPVAERDLPELERMVGGEVLRGRTGGAGTPGGGTVGMLTEDLANVGVGAAWFHTCGYHIVI